MSIQESLYRIYDLYQASKPEWAGEWSQFCAEEEIPPSVAERVRNHLLRNEVAKADHVLRTFLIEANGVPETRTALAERTVWMVGNEELSAYTLGVIFSDFTAEICSRAVDFQTPQSVSHAVTQLVADCLGDKQLEEFEDHVVKSKHPCGKVFPPLFHMFSMQYSNPFEWEGHVASKPPIPPKPSSKKGGEPLAQQITTPPNNAAPEIQKQKTEVTKIESQNSSVPSSPFFEEAAHRQNQASGLIAQIEGFLKVKGGLPKHELLKETKQYLEQVSITRFLINQSIKKSTNNPSEQTDELYKSLQAISKKLKHLDQKLSSMKPQSQTGGSAATAPGEPESSGGWYGGAPFSVLGNLESQLESLEKQIGEIRQSINFHQEAQFPMPVETREDSLLRIRLIRVAAQKLLTPLSQTDSRRKQLETALGNLEFLETALKPARGQLPIEHPNASKLDLSSNIRMGMTFSEASVFSQPEFSSRSSDIFNLVRAYTGEEGSSLNGGVATSRSAPAQSSQQAFKQAEELYEQAVELMNEIRGFLATETPSVELLKKIQQKAGVVAPMLDKVLEMLNSIHSDEADNLRADLQEPITYFKGLQIQLQGLAEQFGLVPAAQTPQQSPNAFLLHFQAEKARIERDIREVIQCRMWLSKDLEQNYLNKATALIQSARAIIETLPQGEEALSVERELTEGIRLLDSLRGLLAESQRSVREEREKSRGWAPAQSSQQSPNAFLLHFQAEKARIERDIREFIKREIVLSEYLKQRYLQEISNLIRSAQPIVEMMSKNEATPSNALELNKGIELLESLRKDLLKSQRSLREEGDKKQGWAPAPEQEVLQKKTEGSFDIGSILHDEGSLQEQLVEAWVNGGEAWESQKQKSTARLDEAIRIMGDNVSIPGRDFSVIDELEEDLSQMRYLKDLLETTPLADLVEKMEEIQGTVMSLGSEASEDIKKEWSEQIASLMDKMEASIEALNQEELVDQLQAHIHTLEDLQKSIDSVGTDANLPA